MNGVHDLGGMHGFGRVDPSSDGELFHEDWERRAFGIQAVAIHGAELFNLHEFRAAREQVVPSEYLAAPYYDNWLAAVEKVLIEKGAVSEAELRERIRAVNHTDADLELPDDTDRELVERTLERVHNGYSPQRDAEPAFEVGDTVVVRELHPDGHTRCPWYTRGSQATIEAIHDSFPVPDALTEGAKTHEPLYTVRFDAGSLWGEDTDGDVVHIDMWEHYLQPLSNE